VFFFFFVFLAKMLNNSRYFHYFVGFERTT